MKEFLDEYLSTILSIIIVILAVAIIAILVFDIKLPKKEEEVNETSDVALKETKEEVNLPETSDTVDTKYYVDIKGAVKKPGVYEVSKEMIINDVIKMAGGFKSDAFTDNINLSHHLEDELVIYVYTKNEYKKNNTVVSSTCNCPTYDISICTDNKSSIITSNSEDVNNNDNVSNNKEESSKVNGKVNINTASKKELMTLSGIGEAKANDIINYRNNNGLFKSIEDIKKVNGIKDGTFNKIKDSITV